MMFARMFPFLSSIILLTTNLFFSLQEVSCQDIATLDALMYRYEEMVKAIEDPDLRAEMLEMVTRTGPFRTLMSDVLVKPESEKALNLLTQSMFTTALNFRISDMMQACHYLVLHIVDLLRQNHEEYQVPRMLHDMERLCVPANRLVNDFMVPGSATVSGDGDSGDTNSSDIVGQPLVHVAREEIFLAEFEENFNASGQVTSKPFYISNESYDEWQFQLMVYPDILKDSLNVFFYRPFSATVSHVFSNVLYVTVYCTLCDPDDPGCKIPAGSRDLNGLKVLDFSIDTSFKLGHGTVVPKGYFLQMAFRSYKAATTHCVYPDGADKGTLRMFMDVYEAGN